MKAAPGSPLAKARMAAHACFDLKWKNGELSRSEAYSWLADQLGIKKSECHMINFDIQTCSLVITICSEIENNGKK